MRDGAAGSGHEALEDVPLPHAPAEQAHVYVLLDRVHAHVDLVGGEPHRDRHAVCGLAVRPQSRSARAGPLHCYVMAEI